MDVGYGQRQARPKRWPRLLWMKKNTRSLKRRVRSKMAWEVLTDFGPKAFEL